MPRRRVPRPVVEVTEAGVVLNLDTGDRALLLRLLDEFRSLLQSNDAAAQPLLRRLFPPAYIEHQHAEAEAEFQRFMREELVTSRLTAIGAVEDVLREPRPFSESTAFGMLHAFNNVRLVLGTLLDVGEDHDPDDIDDDDPMVGEHHLYMYLSWLVNSMVVALGGPE
ncbi:MAG: DUF2017 family protein [Ilumatobacteraceae bacterium]